MAIICKDRKVDCTTEVSLIQTGIANQDIYLKKKIRYK